MNTYCFFAHIAFGTDAEVVAPQATANILIEVNETALAYGGDEKHLELASLTDLQRMKLAGGIAKAAALNYLKESEFSKYPAYRFVDFRFTEPPTYISIRPPPTKVLPDDSKVWRIAQSDSDKYRGKPLSPEPLSI